MVLSGTVTTWAARFVEIRDRMMFSASGMLATMGNAVPYAIGAALAGWARRLAAEVEESGAAVDAGAVAPRLR